MTISGERTEQLDIFCHVNDFTSDFLSFIDVERIRFFHGALQLTVDYCILCTPLHRCYLRVGYRGLSSCSFPLSLQDIYYVSQGGYVFISVS